MDELQKMLKLNIEEVEPETVTPLEKKRLLKNILNKKRFRNFRYSVAVGLLTLGIGSTVILFNPTIASHIPIVSNVVDYFQGETTQFKHFNDYATGIGFVQESNGVKIEIAEAVYDGTTVTITFAIESEKDLGEYPSFNFPIETNGEIEGGSVTWIKKLTDTTYAGVITMTPELNGRSPRTINLTWTPGSIWNYETNETIEGDWSFEFQLKKIDVEGIRANYIDKMRDFTMRVSTVDITGYTINIKYKIKMPSAYSLYNLPYTIDFEVQDEFGNDYEMITNMTSSTTKHAAKGSFTFANLQNGAKELTITPKLYNENEEIRFNSFTVKILE